MSVFEELFKVNVNGHTEDRQGLTYLSWPFAVSEVTKKYPDMSYEVERFNGVPYVYDPLTGYMVFTKVTIEDQTKEMWLPVMDSGNNAMKAEPYEVMNKYGKVTTVKSATMFDINKAIMRCLTKNLAMFGLGLYIYAGEDLPEEEKEKAEEERKAAEEERRAKAKAESEKQEQLREEGCRERYKNLIELAASLGYDEAFILQTANVKRWQDLQQKTAGQLMAYLSKKKAVMDGNKSEA